MYFWDKLFFFGFQQTRWLGGFDFDFVGLAEMGQGVEVDWVDCSEWDGFF